MDSTAILYELVIAAVVAFAPFVAVRGWRKDGGSRVVALFAAALWAVIVYGSFVEPKLLQVGRHQVGLGDGRDGRLRVAVVSDTHLGYFKHDDWVARVVAKVNAEQPDLIVLAGDLASAPASAREFAPFAGLRAKYGSYAVLGNWDYRAGAVDIRKAIESTGVEVLTNESVAIPVAGHPVWLIGLDDYLYGRPDWDAAMRDVPAGAVTIVAAHNPDFAPQGEVRGIDLMLAGHTHCGQVRLPYVGPLPALPDALGRRFDCGVFAYGPMRLFITKGAGESGTRARLFDRPEVSILDISY
jgi:predicted MPP superfamily phosphohydrolase